MKEITVKLYDYDELSDEAKKKAHEDWLSKGHEHFWGGEVGDTLKKLEEELGIEVTNWSYNSCSYDVGPIRFKHYNDDQLALTGIREQAFLWNNFGHLIMQPRTHYYMKIDGKWRNCVGENSRKYKSNVFFDRVYDGTCQLTGVCFDNDALDPLAYFCFGVEWSEEAKKRVMIPQSRRMRWGVTTVEDVLRACVDSLFESAQRDCEYQDSEEYFAEMCSNNGWTFEENGKRMDVKEQTCETMLGLGLQALSELIEFIDLNGYGKGSKAVADARKTRDDIQAWLQRRKFTVVKCCHNCSHLNDERICCCPGTPQYKAHIDDPCGDGCSEGFELSGALAEENIIRTAPEDDDYYEADFPEWALCALVNGDHFEDKDDEMTYNIWLDRMIAEGYDMVSPEVTDDRNEFCSIPEFGLATSTVKVRFRKRRNHE